MASSSVSKGQPPKARKRIEIGLSAPNAKRGLSSINVSTQCESCNKEIPTGTVDMHDCLQESSKTLLAKPVLTLKDTAKGQQIPLEAKTTQKRKAANVAAEKISKPAKGKKDPNEPKRPSTAFFLYMEDFRQMYKKANPNGKGGAAVTKEGGEKWKSMSEEEKQKYVKKAADLKDDYQKALKIYKSAGKESLDSTITDNADEKCDGADESCDETAASAEPAAEAEL